MPHGLGWLVYVLKLTIYAYATRNRPCEKILQFPVPPVTARAENPSNFLCRP